MDQNRLAKGGMALAIGGMVASVVMFRGQDSMMMAVMLRSGNRREMVMMVTPPGHRHSVMVMVSARGGDHMMMTVMSASRGDHVMMVMPAGGHGLGPMMMAKMAVNAAMNDVMMTPMMDGHSNMMVMMMVTHLGGSRRRGRGHSRHSEGGRQQSLHERSHGVFFWLRIARVLDDSRP